jgi:putative tricarboxylic transport membrane protein
MQNASIALAVLLLIAPTAYSQAWQPERKVEIVIPVARGGGTDATGLLVQRMLGELKLVAPGAVATNKPGGGGVEAWEYLLGRRGDGHHLAISTPPWLTNRITGSDSLDYSQFTPITTLYREYVLIAVGADSPIRSGRDLAARFKRDAAGVTIAFAPSLGSHNHIALALVARAAGADPMGPKAQVVNTAAEIAAAATEGRADIVAATAGSLLKYVQAGQLRVLGITAPARLGGPFAKVPTWREQGLDVVTPAWRGIAGPPGMTAAQIRYWEDVFLKLSLDEAWLTELSRRWWDGTYMNSAETRQFLDQQYGLMKDALTLLRLAK